MTSRLARPDRRRFMKGGAALGLSALSPALLLSACGGSDDDPDPLAGEEREQRVLHFDFSRRALAEPRLHLPRSPQHGMLLKVHDDESRARLRAADPLLADVADSALTHYVEDVSLPAKALQAVLVFGKHPDTGAALLAGAHIHVPSSARVQAQAPGSKPRASGKRLAYGIRQRIAAVGDPLQDSIDGYSTPWDVAKYIVFHHPEVMNLNADLGSEILSRIESLPCDPNDDACVPLLSPLAFAIANSIGTAGYPSTTPGGWATLVPLVGSDGNPALDASGQQLYRYELADDITAVAADVIKLMLKNIHDDPLFKDTNWHVNETTATATAGAATAGTARAGQRPTAVREVAAAAAAAADGAFNVQASVPVGSSLAGIRIVDLQVVDAAARKVQVSIRNDYMRYLGVYVQFRDNNTTNDPEGELLTFTAVNELDSSRAYFLTQAPSNIQLMGIPFQGDLVEKTDIQFTMPAGAASASVMFCGLGLGGESFTEEAVTGSLLTMAFNIGLPTLLLAMGVMVDISVGVYVRSLAYNLGATAFQKILIASVRGLGGGASGLIGGIFDSTEGGKSCQGWISGAAGVVIQSILDAAPDLAVNLVEWGAEAETIAAALGPLSIACKVLAALANAAEVGVTLGEVYASPPIARNKISLTMSSTVRISRDPRDFQFPASARRYLVRAYYDGGATPLEKEGTLTQGQVDPIDVAFADVPSGGMVKFNVLLYSDDGCLVGHAESDSLVNLPDSAGLVQLQIVELLAVLRATTQYHHTVKLGYSSGAYSWQQSAAPTQTQSSLCQGTEAAVCELTGITVNTATGMAGYGFSAYMMLCNGSPGIGYTARNIFLGQNPGRAYKALDCGENTPVGIVYDPTSTSATGKHFYIEPTDSGFHLRKVVLDESVSFLADSSLSWGRFNSALDSLTVLPSGYVVGVNRQTHKMESLLLPRTPIDDVLATSAVPFATQHSGQGTRVGLLDTPVALASVGGAVLVLEQGNARVQALDVHGNPVNLFGGGTTNLMALQGGTGAVYLDLATEGQGYIYVLYHLNNGLVASDYRLDVHTPTGEFLFRTESFAAARLAVDIFRNVYALNFETMPGPNSIEPTLSQWLPQTPNACPSATGSSASRDAVASCRVPAVA